MPCHHDGCISAAAALLLRLRYIICCYPPAAVVVFRCYRLTAARIIASSLCRSSSSIIVYRSTVVSAYHHWPATSPRPISAVQVVGIRFSDFVTSTDCQCSGRDRLKVVWALRGCCSVQAVRPHRPGPSRHARAGQQVIKCWKKTSALAVWTAGKKTRRQLRACAGGPGCRAPSPVATHELPVGSAGSPASVAMRTSSAAQACGREMVESDASHAAKAAGGMCERLRCPKTPAAPPDSAPSSAV